MKKWTAILAVLAAAGVTAWAANPFSDVEQDHWAYVAVARLAQEGVIAGYPDGTFSGERNLTRYEMAQMVAKAMAREDQLNAQQRAQVDRLAAEFANELNSLGVRVTNLEDRVGNVKVGGDLRLRVMNRYYWLGAEEEEASGHVKPARGVERNQVDARLGLDVAAKVAPRTNVYGRLESEFMFGEAGGGDVTLDGLYVEHGFGDRFTLTAGRYDVTLGATGVLYDDKIDGATLVYGGHRFDLAAGYGSLNAVYGLGTFHTPDAYYVQGGYNFMNRAGVRAFYVAGTGADKDYMKYYGVGLDADLGPVNVHGDYVKNEADKYDRDNAMWLAGLRYGKADAGKPGSFELGADYVDVETYGYLGGGTTLSLGYQYMDRLGPSANSGAKFWLANAAFVPFENAEIKAFYTFHAKDQDGNDFEDLYRVELNYYF